MNKTRKITASIKTFDLYSKLFMLYNFRKSEMFDDMVNRLIDDASHHAVCFELYIAWIYHSMGLNVEPVVCTSDGKKYCDFIVHDASGERVYIECKSVQNLESEINSKYEPIKKLLSQELKDLSANARVDIYPRFNMEDIDKYEVVNAVKCWVKHDLFGTLERGGAYIEIQDHVIDDNIKSHVTAEHGLIVGTAKVGEDMVLRFENQISIGIHWNYAYDIIPKIVGHIKKARKQIPKDGAGVVHIECSANIKRNIFNLHQMGLVDAVKRLNLDTSRVNAVCLNSRIIDNAFGPERTNYHLILPNFKTNTPLPSNFSLIGSHQQNVDDINSEGHVKVPSSPELVAMLKDKAPRFVAYDIHKHGLRQVMIVKSLFNKLYAHVCSPEFGFLVAISSYAPLLIKDEVEIIVTWGDDDIRLLIRTRSTGEEDWKLLPVTQVEEGSYRL